MSGEWARMFARAVPPGDVAAGDLRVEAGVIAGRVGGHEPALAAERVPAAVWTAMERFARGNERLEAALAGQSQSVQLERLLEEDWDEPLVPAAIERRCTCGRPETCEHVRALARAAVDAIDDDPALLLRWRGLGAAQAAAAAPQAEPTPGDLWTAGELPVIGPPRPLPPDAVLKRLGPSRIRLGSRDLGDVLRRAYEALTQRR